MKLESIGMAQRNKIEREIAASLPKNNELNEFFVSRAIEDDARQLGMFSRTFSGTAQILTPDEQVQLLVEFTANDMQLTQYQKDLKKMRGSENNFTDDAQKMEYQKRVNNLETEIREFDANWAKKERLRIENAKKEAAAMNALESDFTGTGSLENPSTGSGFRVPNLRPNFQSGALDLGVPKIPSISPIRTTTNTGSIAPIKPPIVSGSAVPVSTVIPKLPTATVVPAITTVSGTATPVR